MRTWLERSAFLPPPEAQEEVAADPELGIAGFRYADLYRRERLADLLAVFEAELARDLPELAAEYAAYRAAGGAGWPAAKTSDLLIALGPRVAAFAARLFRVEKEHAALVARLNQETPIVRFRRRLEREILREWTRERCAAFPAEADAAGAAALAEALGEQHAGDPELSLALTVNAAAEMEEALARAAGPGADTADPNPALDRFARAAAGLRAPVPGDDPSAAPPARARAWRGALERHAARLHHADLALRHGWVALRVPEAVDHMNLVRREHPDPAFPEIFVGPAATQRRRDGFGLTDPRTDPRGVQVEVDYCIICHPRGKDSCSRGLHEKDGSLRANPLGVALPGCPLEERISEMHLLRRSGESIAALAMIMIDNPMLPGTGHRICNDCMKACIFQKQEPVNIPQVETAVLSEVLALPWGAEIYMLLTRWNPLNVARPVPAPFHGKKVLVVGLGPAGYTLAHHLLNEGFGVVAIDGLKIEPYPDHLVGGPGRPPRAIRDFRSLCRPLDERILVGFGGVSEYGITVRWDKNFLTLIHLALLRREGFLQQGGARFGGTLTLEDAWEMGFDHVAIAAGAGKPTVVEMTGGLSRGVRQASDFLMALQLTGAFKKDSLANLQVRLPAVVIGGGLTAIDTATEIMAYYPLQVEKVLGRWEALAALYGESALDARLDDEEREILAEFLEHGHAVRAERSRAAAAGEPPDFVRLVRAWGGATIAYRRTLLESPAYRLNHEEVIKCLEEGVRFVERVSPIEVVRDRWGAAAEMVFERMKMDGGKLRATGETLRVPARSICIAAGTSPNVIYEKEHPGTFRLDEWGKFFSAHVAEAGPDGRAVLRPAAKGEIGLFTSYERDGRVVSYYGDNHPEFAGSVVKAMASARTGYPRIVALFGGEIARQDPAGEGERRRAFRAFASRLDAEMTPRVVRVDRLTPTITEVIVHAPLASRQFKPGQFFRLQNYETDSPLLEGTRLALEGIALTGAWVDPERGLLSLIVLEMGASSRLCAILQPGQKVVVMGPTGCPSEIPRGEKILLAGGGLGNAVLFSIAKAMREAGNTVVYFAGYKDGIDLFKREEVEAASDQVIWSTDRGLAITPRRSVDRHVRGNIVQAIHAYAMGDLGETLVPAREFNRILAIGSDRMMRAVKEARHGVLAPHLGTHVAIGSINSSMQCMMKAICGQCLQQHHDAVTGKPTEAVFTCFAQDQALDDVDFSNLSERLRANSLQEKIANLWLDRILERHEVARV